MDFEFYRNFITVAETGNLTAAAKKLAIAQPALTAQIRTLEQYYGTPLVKTSRGKRSLSLTEAGETFLARAQQICGAEDSLLLDMIKFNRKISGTLRFGVSPVKGNFFIRRYLQPFALLYPEICYQFFSEHVNLQTAHIDAGALDFAFADAPLPPQKHYAVCKGSTEYFYLVCPDNTPCPASAQQKISLRELDGVAICCTYGNYSLLHKSCRQYGIELKIRFISNTSYATLTFARSCGCPAIVNLMPDEDMPGCTLLRLSDPELYFEQMLYWNSAVKLSTPARHFLDFYRQREQENQ